MKKWDPDWTSEKVGSYYASMDNYWAGAKKACDDIGMSLPDNSKLQSLYKAGQKDCSLGLCSIYGWVWSSSQWSAGTAYGANYASMVNFDDGDKSHAFKWSNTSGGSLTKVLCVGD